MGIQENIWKVLWQENRRRSWVRKTFTEHGIRYFYIILSIQNYLLSIWTAIRCNKNKMTDSGFQVCCEIFDIVSRSLESNYEIRFKI